MVQSEKASGKNAFAVSGVSESIQQLPPVRNKNAAPVRRCGIFLIECETLSLQCSPRALRQNVYSFQPCLLFLSFLSLFFLCLAPSRGFRIAAQSVRPENFLLFSLNHCGVIEALHKVSRD